MFKLSKKAIFLGILAILVNNCSSTKDKKDRDDEKKYEINVDKRAEAYRDKGGGLFNSNRNKDGGNFQFSTSNVLWRAALESLESIPLNNVDYSGGIIVTDWYSTNSSRDSIKITVRFLSNELSVSSVKVLSHKKICQSEGNCEIKLGSADFNVKIKDKIITKAKEIKIADEKKNKN